MQRSAGPRIIQRAGWKQNHKGEYYWDDHFGNVPYNPAAHPPPPQGAVQAQNTLGYMPDTHKPRSGGNMINFVTRPDHPEQNMQMLAHFASQAEHERGVFYEGPLVARGLGMVQVTASIPPRGNYTTNFSHESGGYRSSTQFQQSLGTGPSIKGGYQILHIAGHGQVGAVSDQGANLCSAGHGTNTTMIPYDNLVSGDTNVWIASYALCRPNSPRAEVIVMQFYYAGFHEPFFVREIDGDLPMLTRSQYEQLAADAMSRVGTARQRREAADFLYFVNHCKGPHGFGGGGPPPGTGGGGGGFGFGGGGFGGSSPISC